MAFGATQEKAKQATTGDEVAFEWPWIPLNGGHKTELKGGIRKIRLLPELNEHGELVVVPVVDRTGKVVKDKMTPVTATETRFTEIWWKFMVDGQERPRRIFVSSDNPWNNPYWEGCSNFVGAKSTEKGSPERKAMKQRFCINVLDRTPVIINADGYPVYADENGVYCLTAAGRKVDVLTGTPEPFNKIRILEQTAGQSGGRHFFQQLVDLIGTVEDSDGVIRDLFEFDVIVKITGADINTNRSAKPTANFKSLEESFIFAPRYDLVTWAKPWPNDAIESLLNGRDYNEVVAEFDIQQYPQLTPVARSVTEEETPFEDSIVGIPKSMIDKANKQRGKKVAAKEEEENLFEE